MLFLPILVTWSDLIDFLPQMSSRVGVGKARAMCVCLHTCTHAWVHTCTYAHEPVCAFVFETIPLGWLCESV